MPVFLEGENLLHWLSNETPIETLKAMLKPLGDGHLRAHTVKPLRGKNSPGNTPDAYRKHDYAECYEPPTLF
jgi:hypothetical protein